MYHLLWICIEPLPDILYGVTFLSTTQELRKLNWLVTLIAPGPAGKHSINNVEITCIPKPKLYLLGQIIFHLRIIGFITRNWKSIDVVLFEHISAPWILPLRFLREAMRRQGPLVVMDTRTLHMVSKDKESPKDRLRGFILNAMNRIANYWADGRTAITPRMAEAVHIPPENLWGIWPSGVDTNKFAQTSLDRKWPLPGEPINIIYIGSLNYQRNLMSLSRAVEIVNSEGMLFTLTLLGDGTERNDLMEFAGRTSGRIKVLRPVPHDQIWQMLATAHIGALPFPDEEKFQVSSPIKMFEYMAAGMPMLATRIACHTDVVGIGEYVFWAENASVDGLVTALSNIWANSDLLSNMGALSLNAVRDWTWHESAKKLKKALEYGLAMNN